MSDWVEIGKVRAFSVFFWFFCVLWKGRALIGSFHVLTFFGSVNFEVDLFSAWYDWPVVDFFIYFCVFFRKKLSSMKNWVSNRLQVKSRFFCKKCEFEFFSNQCRFLRGLRIFCEKRENRVFLTHTEIRTGMPFWGVEKGSILDLKGYISVGLCRNYFNSIQNAGGLWDLRYTTRGMNFWVFFKKKCLFCHIRRDCL